MKRHFFTSLIVLMTISLAGIILLQGYLITDAYKGNEQHFDFNVRKSLTDTSHKIQDQEFLHHFQAIKHASKLLDNGEPIISKIRRHDSEDKTFQKEELHSYVYKALDSVALSIESDTIVNEIAIKHHSARKLNAISDYEHSFYQSLIHEFTSNLKVTQRVNVYQINHFLNIELLKNNIDVDYEFAVYKNGVITQVKSKNFTSKSNESIYSVMLFEGVDKNNDIQLMVNFTGRKLFVIESITLMIILSAILSLVIMVTFVCAYLLLKKQRNVSEVKTDFMNNMTHELKTPIATIGLALDFIRNPKVINDSSLRNTYLEMIDQENKRIHCQVEKVLRISRLEKGEIDIPKKNRDFHKIIIDAVKAVDKQINNSGAIVTLNLNAINYHVFANQEYFKTVIINILDNSIKYNEKTPKINIISENVKNSIILKIEDNGVGMRKESKKRVFNKFFREFTGDIHNVKGCGLGLSYVKQILEDHQGEVIIKSTKGKGTLVSIKLPLIS